MTTKDLIKRLQEVDPEGNTEVVVGSDPIYFVEHLPGYYDGAYVTLIQDHGKDPYYNITGAKVTRAGSKVKIHLMSVEDILQDDSNAYIDTSELTGHTKEWWETHIKQWREESAKIDKDIEEWKKNGK